MAAAVRAVAGAVVTALVATAALALAAQADGAPAVEAPVATSSVAPAAGPTGSVALPPVAVHPVDPQVLDAARSGSRPGGGQSLTEVVQLTIIGGALTLATDHVAVTLYPLAGSDRVWRGVLPPVRVVDARGTHEGWSVRWTVAAVTIGGQGAGHPLPAARVRLDPDAPAVVDGTPDGLTEGAAGAAVPAGRVLFAAAPGSGGGTYEAGATLSVRLPASVDADSVVVELAFALG